MALLPARRHRGGRRRAHGVAAGAATAAAAAMSAAKNPCHRLILILLIPEVIVGQNTEPLDSVEANFKKCKKKQHREIKETASSRT